METLYVRRTLANRTPKAFQDIFKSQNKSLLRQLRCALIALCTLIILTIISYQIYTINHQKIYYKSSPPYKSPLQSFMSPNGKLPTNNKLKQENKGNNAMNAALSSDVMKKLYSEKTKPSELMTSYVSEDEIPRELIEYTHLSFDEECESSTFESAHFYDYLINEDKIDFIFPANDKELYETLKSKEFLNNWDTSFLDDNYWDFVLRLDSESKSDIQELRAKYDFFNGVIDRKRRILDNNDTNRALLGSSSVVAKYFDFNGLTSDLSHYYKNIETVGSSGLYWYTSSDCIHHKGCDIYPIHRILRKSVKISCFEILTSILPSIYECVKINGKKCANIIDSGYYRIIMKTQYLKTGEMIVIKMMKPKSIKKERDLIRHIRESILLGHLYDLESKYMINNNKDNDDIFTESLNDGNILRDRAFNYIPEYGHCVTPLWISISPLYKMALDKWILAGFASKSSLKKLIFMSLQIAKSIEILHIIPGGPYHHTDIQPRQFLLDWNDNVYINDFNRGKFQPYYFDNDNDKISKCWYCGHRSRGHWRAPEEPKKRPLNEKLDIFSMGLTIWSLFSNDIPFKDATFDDLTFIYYDLQRIPSMTNNIPPAIKNIIHLCLSFNPRQRPSASNIVNMLENIYFINLDIITEGFKDYTSSQLLKENIWTETNYPPKQKRNHIN